MLQRRGCIHFPLTAEFKFRRWPVLQDLADPKNAENQKPVTSLGEKKRSLGGGPDGCALQYWKHLLPCACRTTLICMHETFDLHIIVYPISLRQWSS